MLIFFFNDTATTEIYTLSLHDALPILHTYVVRDGVRTVSELVARYAPGGVTVEKSYALFLAREIGATKDQVIDLSPLIPMLMSGIIWYENGQDPYSRSDIRDAIAAASPGE